ncbi:hypothetical protein A6A04_12910 [Paramagnetospirillum marisnigri]|uniref:Uncharacterized protein n=1 Tax=Paramagnetospirillum marisnigri TaxID=1285242 RepID=A0A178MVW2_9PROT|nr:hypothetical protein [Paramagnetospirillum marisnigri]OAN54134.1 hypothetical protein A6A04_12910 [Paramagnetospirillum marisnigri]
MLGFLKGLFGGKKPKPKVGAKPVSKPGAKPIVKAAAAVSEDRAALLKRAREVHKAKRKILDHLSDEDRAKLVGMAILTFLNQGREPDNKK